MSASTSETLTAHLLEIRKRLIRMLVILAAVCMGTIFFANELYAFFSAPLLNALPSGSQMIATEVASPFLTPFKLAVVAAVCIAIPYVLAECWGFLAPGLYHHERKLLLPVLFISTCLFYGGMAFAYLAVFPVMFGFLSQAGPESVTYAPDISQFFNTVVKLLLAFGFAFQIPVITFVLSYLGTITPEGMARKRPYIFVSCFVAGMLLTPPDPLSQVLMALPMWLLFESGLLFSKLLPKRHISELSQ